jgi:hypothetical protein
MYATRCSATDNMLEQDLKTAELIPNATVANGSQQQQLLHCASVLYNPSDELKKLLSAENFPRTDFINPVMLPGESALALLQLSVHLWPPFHMLSTAAAAGRCAAVSA